MTRASLLACVISVLLSGCDTSSGSKAQPEPTRAAAGIELVLAEASEEEASAVIRRELTRAKSEGKTLVVYVGAEWCEPCQHFKQAVKAKKLDRDFPDLRLLEFDRDRAEASLGRAGCGSRLVPPFALPDADGRCSERRFEGSIKGPGAVAEIQPRLAALLR